MSDSQATLKETTYQPIVKPQCDPLLGKVVRTADVPGFEIEQLSGNPHDQGVDWGLFGPAVNGAKEFSGGIYKMAPNQVHPPHYHPVGPEFYYIVEGSCLIQVDEEMIEARPETAIYLPEGTVHAVWTREDESVTIFYTFRERSDAAVTTVWLE